MFFGRCIKLEIKSLVTNDMDIIVPHGLLLVADNSEVENKVVTSRHVIHVEALSTTNTQLYAMSTDMNKHVPDIWSSFQAGEMAQGDLKKVVDELNATDTQTATGQIAVWMVTDSAQRDKLEQFGASASEIEEALDILGRAGVDPPFTIEDMETVFLTCLGLFILVIVLIAVIAFINKRSGGKSGISPQEDKSEIKEEIEGDGKSK